MSHGGNLFPRQLLPGQDSRQYQIKDSRFVINTATSSNRSRKYRA